MAKMKYDDLPMEIKFEIMSYLPKLLLRTIAPVCREWSEIVNQPILVNILYLNGTYQSHENNLMKLKNNHGVRRLQLQNYDEWNWTEFIPSLSNLREIVFFICSLTPESMCQLVEKCPMVGSITLCRCNNLSTDTIRTITRWKLLQEFTIYFRDKIDGSECFTTITDNCEFINKIRSYSAIISDSCFSNLVKKRGSQLKSLVISSTNFTAESFLTLSNCSMLKKLDVTMTKTTDFELMAIKNLNNLRELCLNSPKLITARGFKNLFHDAGFLRLTSLFMSHCPNLSDESLSVVGTRFAELHILKFEDCDSISDIGIEYIVSNCKRLTSMDFRTMPQIEGSWLEHISSKLPDLNFISFCVCPKLTVNRELCAETKKVIRHAFFDFLVCEESSIFDALWN